MQEKWLISLLGLSILCSLACQATSSTSQNEFLTNSFLVRFKRSVDSSEAHEIARRNAFHSLGPVSMSILTFLAVILNVVYFHTSNIFIILITPNQQKKMWSNMFFISYQFVTLSTEAVHCSKSILRFSSSNSTVEYLDDITYYSTIVPSLAKIQ